MNFLAHIFLSGNDEKLMIGNFIADFVKGNKKNDFPTRIKEGIELHRAIDNYTDHHPITLQSKRRLYPIHHKYSGVIVDVFYDHFLAKNFAKFSPVSLSLYTDNCYDKLMKNSSIFPQPILDFLPFMIERNWLLNYASIEGIDRTLKGIGKRRPFENKFHVAKNDLLENYSSFEEEFLLFFPQLINFASTSQ